MTYASSVSAARASSPRCSGVAWRTSAIIGNLLSRRDAGHAGSRRPRSSGAPHQSGEEYGAEPGGRQRGALGRGRGGLGGPERTRELDEHRVSEHLARGGGETALPEARDERDR